jgi:hypothetical protein
MATMAPARVPPAPAIDPGNRAFLAAAKQGVLLIGLCRDTGRHFWYPRAVSPFTLSANVELVPAKGTGAIYSYSVTRGQAPYCIAYVELDEGPRLLTNIVDCDLDALRIGDRVRVRFVASENPELLLPVFAPA